MPLSRRSVFTGLSACCVAPGTISTGDSDSVLSELEREFKAIASTIDRAIDGRAELTEAMLLRLDLITHAIDEQSATTLDGLRVKARVAAWALLGDLDAQQDSELAQQMSSSIVCDLIRKFEPDHEKPGSIARLAEIKS